MPGGRPVRWLENVRPADSVALLESLALAPDGTRERVIDGAIMAIAMHGDPARTRHSNGSSRRRTPETCARR